MLRRIGNPKKEQSDKKRTKKRRKVNEICSNIRRGRNGSRYNTLDLKKQINDLKKEINRLKTKLNRG